MAKFQFFLGGGVLSASQNWKVFKFQDLPKFQFSGGGGGGLFWEWGTLRILNQIFNHSS